MAETLRTALRPIPKIGLAATLFVVLGFVLDAGHPSQLALYVLIGFVVLTLLFVAGNWLLDRGPRLHEISKRMREIDTRRSEIYHNSLGRPTPDEMQQDQLLWQEYQRLVTEQNQLMHWSWSDFYAWKR